MDFLKLIKIAKYTKNPFLAGAPPWTALGELTTLPQTL